MTQPRWVLPNPPRLPKEQQIANRLKNAVGEDALVVVLLQLRDAGYITTEQGKVYFAQYLKQAKANEKASERAYNVNYMERIGVPAEARQYINAYTSPADLADRLERLYPGRANDSVKADIYDNVTKNDLPQDVAIRAAQARITKEQEETELKSQLAQQEYLQAITPQFQDIMNNPGLSAEDKAELSNTIRDSGISGQPLSDYLESWNEYGRKKAGTATKVKQQLSDASLMAFQGSRPVAGNVPDNTRQLSGLGDILKDYNYGGYGEGTALRRLLESDIANAVENTQTSRQAWLNEKPSSQPLSGTVGAHDERRYWRDMMEKNLELSGTLPNDTVLGNTYWGEGGPANVARLAYEGAKGELGKLDEIYGGAGGPEEGLAAGEYESRRSTSAPIDPLRAAILGLNTSDLRQRYNRLPGSGASSRFAPAVRYR